MGSTSQGRGLSSTYGVARSLLTYYGPVWRRGRMSRFYQQFIAEGDLCFDLGAHVGNRVRVWRRLGARVICSAPQRRLDVWSTWANEPAVFPLPPLVLGSRHEGIPRRSVDVVGPERFHGRDLVHVGMVRSGSRCNMNLTRRSHGATTWPAPDAG